MARFRDLENKTLASVEGLKKDSEEVVFKTTCGKTYKMYHDQNCCESVMIDDVCGDVDSIVGSEILAAVEASNHETDRKYADSETYTFYYIRTIKGTVSIRWYGESNGYYSENVDFIEIE